MRRTIGYSVGRVRPFRRRAEGRCSTVYGAP
jgi:hypothetical protein